MNGKPIRIDYRFNYYAKPNIIEFKFNLNNNGVTVGLSSQMFLAIVDEIVRVGSPFLADVREKLAKGISEDSEVKFDQEEWDKNWDKTEESDG